LESTNQKISLENTNVTLYIKREDLLHPYVSGNKFRKLKYNLVQAKSENKKTLLTFGGALPIIFWQLPQQERNKD
jgi:1-aminocyclopropane-1-carboxylate deaminase